MSIKVEVKGCEQKGKVYPRLMFSLEGRVVLFTSKGKGVLIGCVGDDDGVIDESIGHVSEHWAMDRFTDFHGSITLSNE